MSRNRRRETSSAASTHAALALLHEASFGCVRVPTSVGWIARMLGGAKHPPAFPWRLTTVQRRRAAHGRLARVRPLPHADEAAATGKRCRLPGRLGEPTLAGSEAPLRALRQTLDRSRRCVPTTPDRRGT